MRVVWLGCLLCLSGCFMTGYDAHREDMDATVVPDSDSGDVDDDGGDEHDALIRSDASRADAAPGKDGAADDASQTHDDGGVARVDGATPDASVPDASLPDGSVPDASVPDAEVADAAIDAALPPSGDAGTPVPDGSAPMDASMDSGAKDAGVTTSDSSVDAGDAGDGALPPGVTEHTCPSTTTCNYQCLDTPDNDGTDSLDCQYDCYAATCNNACSAGNTCLSNCIGATTCHGVCPMGAHCKYNCTGFAACDGDCQAGSKCEYACTGAVSCKNVNCGAGATCRLSCNYAATCAWGVCSNPVQMTCPDGTLLCGPTGSGC